MKFSLSQRLTHPRFTKNPVSVIWAAPSCSPKSHIWQEKGRYSFFVLCNVILFCFVLFSLEWALGDQLLTSLLNKLFLPTAQGFSQEHGCVTFSSPRQLFPLQSHELISPRKSQAASPGISLHETEQLATIFLINEWVLPSSSDSFFFFLLTSDIFNRSRQLCE